MDFYNLFDLVTGFGCIIFTGSFLIKKMFFLPERLIFSFFPFAATLYVEQMLQPKLSVLFKIFVIFGGAITVVSLLLLPNHFNVSQLSLTIYEGLTLAYLTSKVISKIGKSEKVERSIGIIFLAFILLTAVMIGLDYYRVNVLGLVRITSIIVFPICYVAFLIAYSGDGFSNRRAMKSLAVDLLLVFTQTAVLSFFLPETSGSQLFALAVALLYSQIIYKTISMMMSSSENKKAHTILEKINRLSKVAFPELIEELKKIENIKSARFVTKQDFVAAGIGDAFTELSLGADYFSRQKIEGINLRFEDGLDENSISFIRYSLDAFEADYLFHIPNTNLCFSLKLERFNLDSFLEERAVAIFSQARLAVHQNGGVA